MSLVKLAMSAGSIGAIGPFFTSLAAKSGSPLGYISRKAKSRILTKPIQRFTLSGLANIEAQIRKGRVADSTKILGAIADGTLTGQMGGVGAKFIEEAHKSKGYQGKVSRAILKDIIDDNGKYRIDHIEHLLNQAKKYHGYAEKIKKVPVATIGLTSGAAIGYNKGEKGHKLKSTLKGGAKGAAIGASLRGGMKLVENNKIYKMIPKVHKIYFEDNYWRDQLHKSNKGVSNLVGKGLGKLLTSRPGKRLARIDSFNSLKQLGDTDIKDIKGIFKNTKNSFKTFGDSFRSENYLKQKYGVE